MDRLTMKLIESHAIGIGKTIESGESVSIAIDGEKMRITANAGGNVFFAVSDNRGKTWKEWGFEDA